MQERVSVAMATYNGARFLRDQLDSLYCQTRIPDEIVVCDDRSTDNTVDILKEYAKRGNLTYYVNERNLGINGNFFKAISLCTGDYISICDQDDIWLPEKIERCLAKIKDIENDDYAVVSCIKHDIDAGGNYIVKKHTQSDKWGCAWTLLSYEATCQGCSLIINKKLANYVVKKYNDNPFDYRYLIYDAFIALTGAMIGKKYDLGSPLFSYRHHDKNVLGQKNTNMSFRDHLTVQSKYRGFIPDNRFNTISKIYNIIYSDIKDDDVYSLVLKINNIGACKSTLKGLYLISNLKELSLIRKIKINFSSLVVIILCYLFGVKRHSNN